MKELITILSSDELKVLSAHYGIEPQGNAVFDPHGEFAGKNVLHVKRPVTDEKMFFEIKKKLLVHRAKRTRPHLDDKILTDWNALMISAFALAGRALDNEVYLQAAENAAGFILRKLQRGDGRLLHRYRDGEAAILSGLEDYAFLSAALLDLYESTFKPKYLEQALKLANDMIELFGDQEQGAFYLTAKDGENLVYRPKEVYDGAVPSGNSVAAHTLLRLYHLTGDKKFLEKAEGVFKLFYDDVSSQPGSYCQMMMAVQFLVGPVREIKFEGDRETGEGKELLDHILKKWDPQRVLSVKLISNSQTGSMVQVCENHVCHQPVRTVAQLKNILSA